MYHDDATPQQVFPVLDEVGKLLGFLTLPVGYHRHSCFRVAVRPPVPDADDDSGGDCAAAATFVELRLEQQVACRDDRHQGLRSWRAKVAICSKSDVDLIKHLPENRFKTVPELFGSRDYRY
jgi:hypothetical protein